MMTNRVNRLIQQAIGKPITVLASFWRLISTMTIMNNGGRGVFYILPAAGLLTGQAALLLFRILKGSQPCFAQS